MHNPLLEKLGKSIGEEDRELLLRLTRRAVPVPARRDMVRDPDSRSCLRVLMSGMAYRYKMMRGGRRAITGFVLPGDFCDLTLAITGEPSHCAMSLVPSLVAEISSTGLSEMMARPGIVKALLLMAVAEKAGLREWLANMGQEPAERRVAHLLCELHFRLAAAGQAHGNEYQLALTQEEMGESLGISAVHVNRVLQKLKADGLVRTRGRAIIIPDVAMLRTFAEFDPAYLQFGDHPAPEQPAA